jgi:hypothetical protein
MDKPSYNSKIWQQKPLTFQIHPNSKAAEKTTTE